MRIRIAVIGLLVVFACVCAAKPPFLKVYLATYKIKPESALGKARCLNCHQPPAPPIRNAYGKSVQAAMAAAKSRMVTADILRGIEKKNAGDGVSYVSKIKSDKLPGVAKAKIASKPKKKS
jgi:hypothetical protein